jgi:hypothetical protein
MCFNLKCGLEKSIYETSVSLFFVMPINWLNWSFVVFYFEDQAGSEIVEKIPIKSFLILSLKLQLNTHSYNVDSLMHYKKSTLFT